VRLADLPPLLREERAVAHLLGRRAATAAIPEAARSIVLAGLGALSSQRTFLVLLPTSTAAELVANDLRAYVPAEEVELFPAWETLPFERVSPGVETMGRRLRVMWRLRKPERAPRFVVAGVRALSQRLGPHVEDVEPVTITTGQQVDPAELVAELVRLGYRREYLVEHRGEVSLRGSIVDVFPSTADVPVRVDLWGDEVDRLSEFSVHDQRSTADLAEVEIFPARELLPTDDVRARRAVGPRAVGATRRRSRVRRHGVVDAVAHTRRAHPRRPARRRRAGRARRAEADA
jgi:transcription-repair coupling factor (superfamily II helicase)